MATAKFEEQILRAVRGKNPLIYLHTHEEERAIEYLQTLLAKFFVGGSVSTWSCVKGLDPVTVGTTEDMRDPIVALRQIVSKPRKGIVVMKDLADFMEDPRVVRALRECYSAFSKDFQCAVVITSPVAVLPEALDKEMFYIEVQAPSPEELLAQVQKIEKQYPGARVPPELISQLVLTLHGMTLKEVDHIMHRLFSAQVPANKMLDEVVAEKQVIAKKTGFMEFIPLKFDISKVGGLENVKNWALARKSLFTQDAVKAGAPIPKGVLIMGMSGCGKSMLAKAIAGLWQVPLFRLDMSMIFSGAFGSPELTFHRAIKAAEAVAPIVLWIDEMESALSAPKDVASSQAMTFSTFLTWMQEKPPLIFVAATANRIEQLPAEVIRKGRFDMVFFVDLPNEQERSHIIQLKLQGNGVDPKLFDIPKLVLAADQRNGAEIEEAISAARIEAMQAKRPMTTDDIRHQFLLTVPLSKTMAEQFKRIREWAQDRATPASNIWK